MMTRDRTAATPETVAVSAHAVEQYRHRVRPGLDADAARAELQRLRAAGEISSVAPPWVHAAQPAARFLLLGEDVALPVLREGDRWIATTCIIRQTLTPTRRAAKSARKKSLLASRRARRRARF